jgi:POLQ-like helicase
MPILNVADKYQVNRGIIQNLLSLTSSFSSSVFRFCQELDEFWAFRDLLMTFGQKLTYCCASELEPLMELPYVKLVCNSLFITHIIYNIYINI